MDYEPAKAARISWPNIVTKRKKKKKAVQRSELPTLWLFYVQLFLHLIIFPEIVAKKPTRKCSGIFGSLALLEREVEYRNIWKRSVVVNHLNCPLRLLEPHYISGDQLEKQPSWKNWNTQVINLWSNWGYLTTIIHAC